jgi:hypothetical protein
MKTILNALSTDMYILIQPVYQIFEPGAGFYCASHIFAFSIQESSGVGRSHPCLQWQVQGKECNSQEDHGKDGKCLFIHYWNHGKQLLSLLSYKEVIKTTKGELRMKFRDMEFGKTETFWMMTWQRAAVMESATEHYCMSRNQ